MMRRARGLVLHVDEKRRQLKLSASHTEKARFVAFMANFLVELEEPIEQLVHDRGLSVHGFLDQRDDVVCCHFEQKRVAQARGKKSRSTGSVRQSAVTGSRRLAG